MPVFTTLPEAYPLYDVTNVDLAFSTARGYLHDGGEGRYLSHATRETALVPPKWTRHANALLFNGAVALEALTLKEGVDEEIKIKAHRVIAHLLGSYEPKHEEKEATVGWLLSLYYDEKVPTPT